MTQTRGASICPIMKVSYEEVWQAISQAIDKQVYYECELEDEDRIEGRFRCYHPDRPRYCGFPLSIRVTATSPVIELYVDDPSEANVALWVEGEGCFYDDELPSKYYERLCQQLKAIKEEAEDEAIARGMDDSWEQTQEALNRWLAPAPY